VFYQQIGVLNVLFGPSDERTIIRPDVAYGCGTWPLMLTDEQRLKIFKNGVMRKIFLFNTEAVTGGWSTSFTGDLHDPCTRSNVIFVFIKCRMMTGGKRVAHTGEERYI